MDGSPKQEKDMTHFYTNTTNKTHKQPDRRTKKDCSRLNIHDPFPNFIFISDRPSFKSRQRFIGLKFDFE